MLERCKEGLKLYFLHLKRFWSLIEICVCLSVFWSWPGTIVDTKAKRTFKWHVYKTLISCCPFVFKPHSLYFTLQMC